MMVLRLLPPSSLCRCISPPSLWSPHNPLLSALHTSSPWASFSTLLIVRSSVGADQKSEMELLATKKDTKSLKKSAEWEKAKQLKDIGKITECRVEACNNGGVVVRFLSLRGFLPFSQMSTTRSADENKTLADYGKDMVGKLISVKVIEVNEQEKKLIVSEKQASWEQIFRKIRVGEIFDGKVNTVTDFGAFVTLQVPDGSVQLSGLVHVSEVSWDPVSAPRDVLEVGQDVKVKVIQVDYEKLRLGLSIKQLQVDPLLETLDTLMPVDSQDDVQDGASDPDDTALGTPLPGLDQICEELLKEKGIIGLNAGRQAIEKRVVSQDLEIWLSNTSVEDGRFTLLARAGRLVQEVHVTTTLDREAMKVAVQKVTSRVP